MHLAQKLCTTPWPNQNTHCPNRLMKLMWVSALGEGLVVEGMRLDLVDGWRDLAIALASHFRVQNVHGIQLS
jgi:hypothetical protein